MGGNRTTEPFKALGTVYSEGGREPRESNSPIHVSEQSLWLLPGWWQGTRRQLGVQLANCCHSSLRRTVMMVDFMCQLGEALVPNCLVKRQV